MVASDGLLACVWYLLPVLGTFEFDTSTPVVIPIGSHGEVCALRRCNRTVVAIGPRGGENRWLQRPRTVDQQCDLVA